MPSIFARQASVSGACRYFDDPKRLWNNRFCLEEVSKNLRGRLDLLHRERQPCDEPECVTLKTQHTLRAEVRRHEPCDSDLAACLDGTLVTNSLVHALADGTGLNRGPHTADFVLFGDGCELTGEMSGMTNVGTHRSEPFSDCQECHAPGFMEGRLCGRITKAKDERLLGCRVVAAYRFCFDASEGFVDTEIRGTIEGVLACRCGGQSSCLDFTDFPKASHPNPWEVGGHSFEVFDSSGAPTATTEVSDGGTGGPRGLNAGYRTQIKLAAPTNNVAVTVINYSTPPTIIALDSSGTVVDSATVGAAGTVETVAVSGAGITSVVVRSPQNETLILEVCAAT